MINWQRHFIHPQGQTTQVSLASKYLYRNRMELAFHAKKNFLIILILQYILLVSDSLIPSEARLLRISGLILDQVLLVGYKPLFEALMTGDRRHIYEYDVSSRSYIWKSYFQGLCHSSQAGGQRFYAKLTHTIIIYIIWCSGLATPYGNIDLGQHLFR